MNSNFTTRYAAYVVAANGISQRILGTTPATLDAAKALLRRVTTRGANFDHFRIEKLVAAPYDETDGRGYTSVEWKYFDGEFKPVSR